MDSTDPDFRYATVSYATNGTQTDWEINFAGGYISPADVQAYSVLPQDSGLATDRTVHTLTLVNPSTVRITPAVAGGRTLTIYRNTQKTESLVNYADGSVITEDNLDLANKQATFNAAEFFDQLHEVEDTARLAYDVASALVDPDVTNLQFLATKAEVQFLSDHTDAAFVTVNGRLASVEGTTAGLVASVGALAEAGGSAGVGYSAGRGSSVVRTVQARLRDNETVADYGAVGDGVTNATGAFDKLRADSGTRAVLPKGTVPRQWKLSSLATTTLTGLLLDVPEGDTLRLSSSSDDFLTNTTVARQTRLLYDDINCDFYATPMDTKQRDKKQWLNKGDLRTQTLIPVDGVSGLAYRSIGSLGDDVFASTIPTTTTFGSYSYGAGTAQGKWYGGFIALARGETYTAVLDKLNNGYLGVMFRHTGGYSVLASDPTSPSTALMCRFIKATSGTVVSAQDTPFPDFGSQTSYAPDRSVWGVTIKDNGAALITLNGRAFNFAMWAVGLGDILEVAYVWSPTNAASACTIYDMTIERNSDPLGHVEIPEIRVFGDSTSAPHIGGWQQHAKDLLDHTYGVKVFAITNYAVPGTNSAGVVSSIASNGLGQASYVVVGTGTNDIQGGSPLSSTDANMRSIINSIKSAGRVPVIVAPYMWYTQAQAITGRGQASTMYDQGSKVRSRITRICAELGAVLVDPCRELPQPKPSYVTLNTDQDPLVFDNIHESALGYKLYARAIARAIASYHMRQYPDRRFYCPITAYHMPTGDAIGSQARIWRADDGQVTVQGNFARSGNAAYAAGVTVLTLPRWARPSSDVIFEVATNTGAAGLRVASTGVVTVDNVTGASPTLINTNVSFNT